MGTKSSRRKAGALSGSRPSAGEVPVVGAREPCPCGSGRRYKACHGRTAAQSEPAFVPRPFQGLPGECDWVAMREIVPAGTAQLHLADGSAQPVAATVLPMAWPGLVRQDGAVFVALQAPGGSGDPSRDIAYALEQALQAEPGTPIPPSGLPGPGPRLQDLLDLDQPFVVEVHQGFDFWLEGVEERSPDVVASMERANQAAIPTERLTSVEAAYWCRIRDRTHLRWVLPYDEDALLDALARLHARSADTVGEGSRYVGAFRAHGLMVPVWDLPPGTAAADVEEPVSALAGRLDEALAESAPLTDAQRRARAGLASRQLTLR